MASQKRKLPYSVKVEIFENGKVLQSLVIDSGPTVFGRGEQCDVVLASGSVSEVHASLEDSADQVVIRDLRSKNGVVIDGQRVNEATLYSTTEVRLGALLLILTPLHDEKAPIIEFETRISKLIPDVTALEKSSRDETTEPAADMPAVVETLIQQSVRVQPLPAAPTVPVAPPASAPASLSFQSHSSPISSTSQEKSKHHSHSSSRHSHPVINRDFAPEFLDYHQGLSQTKGHRLEAVLTWRGTVHEVKEFIPNEQLTVGPSIYASLNVPVIKKGWKLADVGLNEARIAIPKDQSFRLRKNGREIPHESVPNLPNAKLSSKGGLIFKLEATDILDLDLGSDMKLVLRYIPASKGLTVRHLVEPDLAIKRALTGSALVHFIVAAALIMLAPEGKKIPKLKNVEERYARLLMDPPKPIVPVPEVKPPPPPEPPKPEEKKPEPPKPVVKKEEKIPPKPKKIVEAPTKLKKLNKLPITVKKANREAPKVVGADIPKSKPEPKPVKVESLGALAGLASSNELAPASATKDIQINKDAGGAPGTKVSVSNISVPKSSGKGMLVASGGGGIRTGGKGIGSGSAYGTQGLSGKSGSRMIAGSIVGTPVLAKGFVTEGLSREQVMAEVKKHVGEVQACYERSLVSDPNLNGRMEFEWEISPSGSVNTVQVKKSSVAGGDSLGECVKDIFRKMKFPKAKNGQTTTPTIGFPFGRM